MKIHRRPLFLSLLVLIVVSLGFPFQGLAQKKKGKRTGTKEKGEKRKAQQSK